METWAAKLIESLNKNTIVNASKGLEHLIMNEDDHDHHDHPDGEHHHNHSYDPHLWTSIRNSIHMVENITKAIIQDIVLNLNRLDNIPKKIRGIAKNIAKYVNVLFFSFL